MTGDRAVVEAARGRRYGDNRQRDLLHGLAVDNLADDHGVRTGLFHQHASATPPLDGYFADVAIILNLVASVVPPPGTPGGDQTVVPK